MGRKGAGEGYLARRSSKMSAMESDSVRRFPRAEGFYEGNWRLARNGALN